MVESGSRAGPVAAGVENARDARELLCCIREAKPIIAVFRVADHLDHIQSTVLVKRHSDRIDHQRLRGNQLNLETLANRKGVYDILR